MLRVVGLVVVLLGVTVFVIGREGVLWSQVTHQLAPVGQAVTTSPAVTAFAGATLVVEATVDSGSVFVGVAHPIDVRDWLGGSIHTEITEVGAGEVGTRVVPGESSVPEVPATSARFWSASVTGGRQESLRVPLDGSPVQVVVASTEVEDVALRLGVETPALRPLSGGVVLVGAALLVGSFVTRRRREPRDGADAVASRGVILALVLLPLLGGCGVVPERAEAWDLGEVTKPALTVAEAPALLADYDRRNNAAIIATAAAGDPKAWATADAEVILDQNQFATHLASLRKDKEVHGAMTHTADRVWAPEFTQYPMYAITTSTLAVKGEEAPAPEYRRVSLWLRSSSTSAWLLAGSAGTTTVVPKAVPAGEPVTPAPDDRALAEVGAEAIMAYLRTAKPGKVSADEALKSLAEGRSFDTRSGHRIAVDLYDAAASEQVGVDGSIRAVRVDGGILAHVSLRGRESYTAAKGGYVSWNNPDYAEALGELGVLDRLNRDIGVSVFYLVGEDTKVQVLASNWDVVR